MEMKIISDSTVKITITLEDLEERDMELSDFLVPQEKTEEFFYSILDEIELPESFKNSGMLSFRVTPKPKHIDVFVTKSDFNKEMKLEDLPDLADLDDVSDMTPEDLLKTLEKAMKDVSDPEAQARLEEAEKQERLSSSADEESEEEEVLGVHAYVLHFSDIRDAIRFAHSNQEEITLSELYKDKTGYYLAILMDLSGKRPYYAEWVKARFLEFSSDTTKTRPYLAEHAQLILANEAVEQLSALKYQLEID
ncbi:adaptor protein MecA [Streptococcus sp. SGI.013]|uniref:adaptor protein MecA n=1 Tax=unclassified Streptococcus TaxID=2608887 RepID=UPI003CFD29E4